MKRRDFLATTGALVVALAWRDAVAQGEAGGDKGKAPGLPGSLAKEPMIDGWIRIDADGRITVMTGKAELGQGIKTALIQVAAEELVVDPARITLVTADTERTADEGYTAGSHSMQDSGTAIRHAAAQARALLLGRAAERLSMPVDALTIDDGVVVAGDRRVAYGALVAGDALHARAVAQSVFRDPRQHRVMGRSMPRVDIRAKVAGGAAYVQDLRPDGMVHGRVLRPPSASARLTGLDAAPIEQRAGVLKVVRDGRFVGVVAEREFDAVTAMQRLAALAQWQLDEDLPDLTRLHDSVRSSPSDEYVILDRRRPGDAGATPSSATTLTAEYRRPYQMHASIGPSCAIAQCIAGRYTVWTHTQGVYPLRKALAEMLGIATTDVHCIHVEGSGCYGHNGADDVAADAVLLARAVPGRPVRVQWMRQDEHGSEPLGPPMIATASASLDASGAIVDWRYEVWSATHNARPGAAGNLLAATHLAQPFTPPSPKPIPQPEGGGDRNAIPLYAVPNAKVVHRFVTRSPLRTSALRSLGAYLNVFAIESFVDELAMAAQLDPVAFRRRHLDDPRALDVIGLAAERFGWSSYRRSPAHGRGFAFARYKNLAGFAAIACEVEVRRDTGEIRIARVVAAVDGGAIVSPDGIRNQIEGGIVQSASWTTVEAVAFDRRQVTALDWGGYPILRFPQVPERIDVHLIDRPHEPFLGVGEVAQGPAAAALANAFADATGVRIRELPLSRSRVKAVLGP